MTHVATNSACQNIAARTSATKWLKWSRICAMYAMGVVFILGGRACERDTVLTIVGGNPPQFRMRGNGLLGRLSVRGPRTQRDVKGEAALYYWQIEDHGADDKTVERMGTITYGEVPDGFRQVYPDAGKAPPLIEGERYLIRVETGEANGATKYFVIRNNKVEVSDY
jgi:hypothetical protein